MKRAAAVLFLSAVFFAQLFFAFAQPLREVEITAEPHHHLVLQNEQIRVFRVEVPPHSETLTHWHRHDYIYVALGESQLANAVKGKDPITLTFHDGDTAFVASGFAHYVRTLGERPFRNVTVELLQDEKLRKLAGGSNDRALEILSGGTKEVLFVKDGVRASEIELQPGGMMPALDNAALVIAIGDIELRGEGRKLGTLTLKAGESKWVPQAGADDMMNTGSRVAKFVTLEFPKI